MENAEIFFALCITVLLALVVMAACQKPNDNANTTATTTVSPPAAQTLTVVPRPPAIINLMKERGEQDEAKPTLRILSPAKDATINGSTVNVKLEVSGDLKGYQATQDPATGKGNLFSDSRQSAL